jgi:hypothetical protein
VSRKLARGPTGRPHTLSSADSDDLLLCRRTEALGRVPYPRAKVAMMRVLIAAMLMLAGDSGRAEDQAPPLNPRPPVKVEAPPPPPPPSSDATLPIIRNNNLRGLPYGDDPLRTRCLIAGMRNCHPRGG